MPEIKKDVEKKDGSKKKDLPVAMVSSAAPALAPSSLRSSGDKPLLPSKAPSPDRSRSPAKPVAAAVRLPWDDSSDSDVLPLRAPLPERSPEQPLFHGLKEKEEVDDVLFRAFHSDPDNDSQ